MTNIGILRLLSTLTLCFWTQTFSKVSAQLYNEQCERCIEIDVYFHAIAFDDGTYHFHNTSRSLDSILSMIRQGMNVLNKLFNNTPFTFICRNINNLSTLNNTLWTTSICNHLEIGHVGEWRFLGGRESINVYLGHQTNKYSDVYVGCGSFPSASNWNGIGMDYEILPPLGNGLTLAHEVGHWLGLYHTYSRHANKEQFGRCDIRHAGDFVDDTPLQKQFLEKYNGQTRWDSCPDAPGEDAFFNIMNRVCFRRTCFGDRGYFTKGQVERMYLNWLFIRKFNEDCGTKGRLLGMNGRLVAGKQTVLIFDSKGNEVFNMLKFWQNSRLRFRTDLCLLNDATYFILFLSRQKEQRSRFRFTYSVNGDPIAVGKTLFFANQNLSTFSLIPSNATTVFKPSPLFSSFPPLSGDNISMSDCGDNDAFLEVDIVGSSYEWLGIFDTAGLGAYLNSTRACIPKGFPYVVLVGFMFSNATALRVYLDGTQIRSVDGPFHKSYFTFPQVVCTFISPEMIGGDIDGSRVNISSVTPFVTIPSIDPGSGDFYSLGDEVKVTDKNGLGSPLPPVSGVSHYTMATIVFMATLIWTCLLLW